MRGGPGEWSGKGPQQENDHLQVTGTCTQVFHFQTLHPHPQVFQIRVFHLQVFRLPVFLPM